jgi:hypothetical protein
MWINPFRHKEEKGTKPTKKQGKNPQVKKTKVLWKDASAEPGSQSPITWYQIGENMPYMEAMPHHW